MNEGPEEEVEISKRVFEAALDLPPEFAVLVGEYFFLRRDRSFETLSTVMGTEEFAAYAEEYREIVRQLPEGEALRDPLEKFAEEYEGAVDHDEK